MPRSNKSRAEAYKKRQAKGAEPKARGTTSAVPSGAPPAKPGQTPGELLAHMGEPFMVLVGFMVEGATEGDIRDYARQAWPDLDYEAELQKAHEHFEKVGLMSWAARKGWAVECLTDLYRRMSEAGDYVGALRAVTEITKLSKPRTDEGSGKGSKGKKKAKTGGEPAWLKAIPRTG